MPRFKDFKGSYTKKHRAPPNYGEDNYREVRYDQRILELKGMFSPEVNAQNAMVIVHFCYL